MSIQQLRSYVWFGNCLTSRKQFFSRVGTDRSYVDGVSILSLTKGCSTKASSLIKEVPRVAGGGGGRATLDIQFKITCLK